MIVDYAAATLCTPYPGTGIAKFAVDNNYFSGDFDLIDDSYYTESVLTFSSASEKRQIENLHKLFAVTAAIPALKPLVRQLIKLPPNDWFYSASPFLRRRDVRPATATATAMRLRQHWCCAVQVRSNSVLVEKRTWCLDVEA